MSIQSVGFSLHVNQPSGPTWKSLLTLLLPLPPFSLSTIVYEMVTVSRPFRATPGELIVWEVGNGRCQSLHHMNPGKLRDIIKHCWTSGPEYRPTFKELLSTLEHNVSIFFWTYNLHTVCGQSFT